MPRAAASRRAGNDKRAAILEAALTLFGRYGYRRTSIDDIAREARIAKGTVYLYVNNKDALFRALSQSLLARVLEHARRATAQKAPVGERLLAILEAKFAFFHELLRHSPHASELMDSTNRLCADIFATGDAAYARVLTKAVADAARRGELSPKRHGLTAEQIAELLVAGAHGIGAMPGVVLSDAEFRTRLATFVRVTVAGLTPR